MSRWCLGPVQWQGRQREAAGHWQCVRDKIVRGGLDSEIRFWRWIRMDAEREVQEGCGPDFWLAVLGVQMLMLVIHKRN